MASSARARKRVAHDKALPALTLLACLAGCAAVDASGADASGADASGADAAAPALCNGSALLCARRLDDICLAGAHNAMSSAAEGWYFPNQDLPFDALLDLGVRALLLDVHVYDDPDDDAGDDRGPELWLCHGSCQLGKTRFATGLARLATWLDAHPRDLVVVVLEVAAPTDKVVAALDAAGLGGRALAHAGGPLPTLGALLDAGVQLVIGAESGGGAPGYYHDVWQLVQDTPYTFPSMAAIADFASGTSDACRHNRGAADAPLLQVNHWVAKLLPAPALSEQANALDVLLARIAHCEALRGQMVNLLVVDHASRGAVVEAAAMRNGLLPAP